MAIATTDPYSADPSLPRKVTPTGVVLDPAGTQAPLAPSPGLPAPTGTTGTAPTSAPTSALTPPTSPNVDPISNSAAAIQQLPDGVGGAVTVPPPSMAPPSVVPPMTPFTQGSNLINQQINPSGSARLLNTQGLSDQALNAVVNGPDRVALGQQDYDTFAKRAAANFGRSLTDATNQASAHGQIGSGMLTNRYGDLAERFNLDNTTAASDFATRALEGTIGDRLNNYGATRSAEAQQYGEDASNRNELRGERGYQQSLAEQAIQRRIQQQLMEQGQQAQDFGQAATLYGLGQSADPTSAYQNAAGLASGESAASSADVGALLRAWLARQQGTQQGTSSGGY